MTGHVSSQHTIKPFVQQKELSRLLDFCERSQPLLLLTGPLGSGKSTLLQACLLQADIPGKVQLIPSTMTLRSAELAGILTSLTDCIPRKKDAPPKEQLLEQLSHIRHSDKRLVLLFDDAHLLVNDLLQNILTLAQASSDKPSGLSVILAGDTSLLDRVDALSEELSVTLPLVHWELPPLTFEQTKDFLQEQLTDAPSGSYSFSREQIRYIYNMSAGIPGRIQGVAKRVLCEADQGHNMIDNKYNNQGDTADSATLDELEPSFSGIGRHRIRFMSILLLLALAGLGGWWTKHRQTDTQSGFKTISMHPPIKPKPTLVHSKTPTKLTALSEGVTQNPATPTTTATPLELPTPTAQPIKTERSAALLPHLSQHLVLPPPSDRFR